MGIKFDNLPQNKPEEMQAGNLPSEGFHKVTIKKAEVKTSKAGNEYINLQLKTEEGPMVFDVIMDSDKPALQYKLGRLIRACKFPLQGELTLEDLAGLLEGKQIVADIHHIEDTYNNETKTKAEVDIFKNDIFYTIEEFAGLTGASEPEDTNPDSPGVY